MGASFKTLHGFAADLRDAYAEIYPRIEVVFDPEEIKADLIVMAGGATLVPGKSAQKLTQDFLAEQNLPVFQRYASALAKHGHGNEIVICISNPNELAVAVFAKHLDRQRVIGMGAFLDSWRFRGEIALDLNIRRQRIHGFMVGEHGANLVPLWSSVHIYGYKGEKLRDTLTKIRRGYRTANFPKDVGQALGTVKEMIGKGEIRRAYDFAASYPPDMRAALKPYITHFSGSGSLQNRTVAPLAVFSKLILISPPRRPAWIIASMQAHSRCCR